MRRTIQNSQILAPKPETGSEGVGSSLKHESAEKQVSGNALFLDDYLTSADCLHAALVLSDIGKGRINSIDLSEVETAPGVVRVIAYEDIPGENDIGLIFKGDPLLSDGEIRYHRQPVALVLAESHRQAWKAAQKARLVYEQDRSPVVSYEQAKHNPPVLPCSKIGTNKAETSETEANQAGTGDLATDVVESDLLIQGELFVGGQEHLYLEGQGSLAEVTEDGGIFLRTSSQNPTEAQKKVSQVLAIPFNKVTVETRRMGGAFGGKETNATSWACLASLGAWLTGRAVKIRLPRVVDMMVTGKRHSFFNGYQFGTTKEGIIKKARIELSALCGHSPDISGAVMERALLHCDNAYHLGDVSVTGNHLRTDTVSSTAFRGFGAPQAVMGIEKVMQELSIRTGLDSLDIRLRNLYREGRTKTYYGMEVEQTDTLCAVMKKLEKSSDYRQRRSLIQKANHQNRVLKKGLALTPVKFGISFTATHLNQSGALIHIYTDGSVQVSHGGTEMGQGLYTKIQQVVAHTLGISSSLVLITSTRTDKVPNTSPTAASSGADLNGMAAYNAANTLKSRLIEFAKEYYGLSGELKMVNGTLVSEKQEIGWVDLIQQAYLNRISLSTVGFYKTPKIGFDKEKGEGRPFYYFSIGAACSEVIIDTLTGEMSVERVDILFDVGKSLNPAIDIGQIEGGFIQGMGWLTCEELVWNEQGVLLSNSPVNYKIPTVGDYPRQMNIALYDSENPEHNIYRSKAIGEPPFLLAISVWCAIYDAIASISNYNVVPSLHVPATGEKILAACDEQYQAIDSDKGGE